MAEPPGAPGSPAQPAAPAAARRADRLRRLAATRLYLCTGPGPNLAGFVAAVTAAGVGAVQYRDKSGEWTAQLAGLDQLRRAAEPAALIAGNDRADVAAAAGVDVLHLGQDDLPPALARRWLGVDVLLGRSCHDQDQVEAALADPDVDYFCVGPTWPTPTKPGRPAPGLPLVRYAARCRPDRPWFAIGGIDEHTLDAVLEAGGRRVVVVRALTEAADPAVVATALYTRLQEAG